MAVKSKYAALLEMTSDVVGGGGSAKKQNVDRGTRTQNIGGSTKKQNGSGTTSGYAGYVGNSVIQATNKDSEYPTAMGAAKDSDLWLNSEMPKFNLTPSVSNAPVFTQPSFDMDEIIPEDEYVYSGPNYMAQKESIINSLYNNSIVSAQSAYNRLREEAERQALYKKGQSNTRRITMQKYVPETLRAMGLMNSGLSADALIGMDAKYTQFLLRALAEEEDSKRAAEMDFADRQRAAEYQKAQQEYNLLDEKQSAWETLQQMALSGNYNEEALQNYGYSWGFDNTQVESALDVYRQVAEEQAAAQAEADAANKKNTNATLAGYAAQYIDNGYSLAQMELALRQAGYTEDEIAIAKQYYTEQENLATSEGKVANFNALFNEIVKSDMSDVEGILQQAELAVTQGDLTSEDYKRLEYLYAAKKNLSDKYITKEEYDTQVQAIRNGTYGQDVSNNATIMDNTAVSVADTFAKTWGQSIEDDASVINVNGNTFNINDFGKYNDTDVIGSGQDLYIKKIISDAKTGKIEGGQVVVVNYGKRENKNSGVYMYVGDGYFVKLNTEKEFGHYRDKLYVPDGYYVTTNKDAPINSIGKGVYEIKKK